MRTFSTNEWVAITAAVAIALFMFFGGSVMSIFSPKAIVKQAINPESTNTDVKNTSTITGLEIYAEVVGTGTEAVVGKTVTAHYTGTLVNGFKFDSSVDRGQPFSFALGAGQVIKGWDLGIQGMKIGGKRRLVISPDLGYGSQEVGGVIPANSTLIFEVELIDVK